MNKIDLMVERWRKAGINEESIEIALDVIKRAETDPFSPHRLKPELALCQRYYKSEENV